MDKTCSNLWCDGKMKITVTNTEIDGLKVIEPKVFADSRGYFTETYNKQDFYTADLEYDFVQDNQSKSSKGVIRGLHFQKKYPQAKLVRVLEGVNPAEDINKLIDCFWFSASSRPQGFSF